MHSNFQPCSTILITSTMSIADNQGQGNFVIKIDYEVNIVYEAKTYIKRFFSDTKNLAP